MKNVFRVRAKLGRLVPAAQRPRQGGIQFIGWRECAPGEKPEHVIPGAPGVNPRLSELNKGQPLPAVSENDPSGTGKGDLFLPGGDIGLTRNDVVTGKPMIITVKDDPSDPLYSIVRNGLRDGDLDQVSADEEG